MAARSSVPTFNTLKDCLQFLEWLHRDGHGRKMQEEVAKELEKRLTEQYRNLNQGHIASALTAFLGNVSAFYKKLCNIATPGNYGTLNAEQVMDALLECIPKFFAAVYYLLYDVNATFANLGGGGWKLDYPGGGSWGGDLDKYLHAPSHEKKYGVIPGGFGNNEVRYGYGDSRNGYKQGKDMAKDLERIVDKHSSGFNVFLDVFSTSVIPPISGHQDSNTANALALVRSFCEIVGNTQFNDNGGELIRKLNEGFKLADKRICWSNLKVHCSQLVEQFKKIFNDKRFSFTGYKRGNDELYETELAKKTAEWLRINLPKVRNNFLKIQHFSSKHRRLTTSQFMSSTILPETYQKELAEYFTEFLFPYGFTLDETHFGNGTNPYQVMNDNWNSVLEELNKEGDGLQKLVEILNGKNCRPQNGEERGDKESAKNAQKTEATTTEAAKHVVTKAEATSSPANKADATPNQGKKAEGAQNQGKKAEGAQNQGKKAEGAQNQGKKTEGAQNQGKKTEGAQNQGKKSEGAQNQGKKVEGAQNQGKKAEGAQNQGGKGDDSSSQTDGSTQPSSVTSQDPQSSGASGSSSDKGLGDPASSSGAAQPRGQEGQEGLGDSNTGSSAVGSGSGDGEAGNSQTQQCSGGIMTKIGETVYCQPTNVVNKAKQFQNDIEKMMQNVKVRRAQELKDEEEDERRRQDALSVSHPLVRSSDYYHYYRDNYYNIPPPISQDTYTTNDRETPALDGVPQEDASQSSRLNDVVRSRQNDWDRYYLLQQERKMALQHKLYNDFENYFRDSAIKMKEAEAARRQQAKQKTIKHIEQQVTNRSRGLFPPNKSPVPLVTESVIPASPFIMGFGGPGIDPTLIQQRSPTSPIQHQPVTPPQPTDVHSLFPTKEGLALTSMPDVSVKAINISPNSVKTANIPADLRDLNPSILQPTGHIIPDSKLNLRKSHILLTSKPTGHDHALMKSADTATFDDKIMLTMTGVVGKRAIDADGKEVPETVNFSGQPFVGIDGQEAPHYDYSKQQKDADVDYEYQKLQHQIDQRQREIQTLHEESLKTIAEQEVLKNAAKIEADRIHAFNASQFDISRPPSSRVEDPDINFSIQTFHYEDRSINDVDIDDPYANTADILKDELKPPEDEGFSGMPNTNFDLDFVPERIGFEGYEDPGMPRGSPRKADERVINPFSTGECLNPWSVDTSTSVTSSPPSPPPDSGHLPPPKTIREMLYWFVRLNQYGLIGFITEHVEGLLKGYNTDAFEVTGDPTELDASMVAAKLTETCLYAASVIYRIKYKDSFDAYETFFKDQDKYAYYYSTDPAYLLCQLRDYVYACHHQLQFLKAQCSRGKSHSGWRDCHYGSDITASKSPLQAFLTDGWDSTFETHPFDPCNLCHKSGVRMGFRDKDLPSSQQIGATLATILSPSCGGDDPLLTLSSYLNCLTRRTPRTTGELVSFFHHFGNSLHDYSSDIMLPLGESLSTSHADCPDWDRLDLIGLQAVRGIRGTQLLNSIYNSKHDKDHPGTLSTLVGCGSDPDSCHPRMSPITYRAYALYSQSFAHTYLSWTVYLPDRLWESLQKLHYDLLKHCGSGKCTSLYSCTKAMPLLYLHGFTPPEVGSQPKLTCSDVMTKLEEIVNGGPMASLMTATDDFLYDIREPFIYTVVALWSLAFLIFANTMLYRIDILHIRSHLIRTNASHLIDVKALLSDNKKMLSLYDANYFDDDPNELLNLR